MKGDGRKAKVGVEPSAVNWNLKRNLSERHKPVRIFHTYPSQVHRLKLPLIFVLSLFLAGCSQKVSDSQGAKIDEINVAAAANLTDAFEELGGAFSARTGIRVVYSFGSSADLARQIENSAPYDIFASADVENIDRVDGKGLLAVGTRMLFARGRLVLWTPPGARFVITRLEDLNRSEIERIGIAKPEVSPYGRATIEALRALNLWPQLETKVIYGQNVSQIKQYAVTGNIDAGFIPLALAHGGTGQILEVDDRLHQPINQAIAIVKTSQKQKAAHDFIEFLMSQEGQALLARYGYRRP